MSEYQYYEWRAIDRPLTPEEQAEVNSLSSHIYVDSSRAWVEYHWSSFRHDPQEVLACYFDAFLYWASWGSRQLMFRFPKELLDAEALTPYLVPDHIELEEVEGAYVLVLWLGEIEEWDYPYPEGWDLGVLIALRNDILAGDYRALYLAWLKLAEVDEGFLFPEDRPEPPVPQGLKRLSPALEALVRFLELDRHLLQVAAQAGEDAPPSQLGREVLEDAIRLLPLDERDEFLRRLLRDEPHLSLVLQRRLQSVVGGAPRSGVASPSRTVEELRLAAEALAEEERR